jgi:hypothetical protein
VTTTIRKNEQSSALARVLCKMQKTRALVFLPPYECAAEVAFSMTWSSSSVFAVFRRVGPEAAAKKLNRTCTNAGTAVVFQL